MSGAITVLPIPEDEQLKKFTEQVYKNCPYSDKNLTAAPPADVTAIPQKVGDPSPIKYVIYVIKENRTTTRYSETWRLVLTRKAMVILVCACSRAM